MEPGQGNIHIIGGEGHFEAMVEPLGGPCVGQQGAAVASLGRGGTCPTLDLAVSSPSSQ